MNKNGEQEFKNMLKELKQKNSKPTLYELELKNQNSILGHEIETLEAEKSVLMQKYLEELENNTDIIHNVKVFCKKEAISLMRMCKTLSEDKQLNEELQHYINHFIFKLQHCIFR